MLLPLSLLLLLTLAAAAFYALHHRRTENAPGTRVSQATTPDYPDSAPSEKTALPKAARESVDRLQVDDKKESVAHGIIILRWLRNIKFNDKSLQEVLEAGTREDREELRGIVSHVVQLYEGMMAGILDRSPQLALSEKVLQAKQAAKALQHSIKILVALEKPTHMAQASQSINSDITQQPEHWNELKNQTVDRLMQTLKGALESAFGAMEQQAHDQERQQEEAVEQAADALNTADIQKRKRRRQRRQQAKKSAQVNAFNKRSKAADINGDGVADQLQNLSQTKNPIAVENPLSGLMAKDMDIVSALRKALTQPQEMKDGKEAKSAGGLSGLAVTDVSLNDKLAPDDADIATKIIDQRKREQGTGGKLV